MADPTRREAALAAMAAALFGTVPAAAQVPTHFVAAWTGSVHGPYPSGSPTAEPDLRWAFPDAAEGARDQTFRLTVKPDIWGRQARIRLSNAFGTKGVTFGDVHVGLQMSGAALVAGTNRPVTFGGKPSVVVAPGKSVQSDPVALTFVHDPADPLLSGRKLSVSFQVVGTSGPMTWHAKAVTTSYLSVAGTGSHAKDEGEAAFPFSTTSWYFLDEVDMAAPAGTKVVVGFGDSITDGTATTINGDDRWTDVLSRRLKAARVAAVVVNAGIGGNCVISPEQYPPPQPFAGGPSALSRLERDVLSLPGVTHVIWLEGINDLGKSGGSQKAEAVIAGFKDGVSRMRARLPGVQVIGATITSALGSTNVNHGSPEQDAERKKVNAFIRNGRLFDGVADFDAVTLDPATGGMRAMFVPESSTGGPGDKLHPNRAGYAAMAAAIDLGLIAGRLR